MSHNRDKSLDWLNSDLTIALSRLETSKKGNVRDLFSHVRKGGLGIHQKAWEAACMRQLSDAGFIIFDDSDGEIVLTSGNLSNIIRNSDKIWELAVKAYDSVTGSSIWDEAVVLISTTEHPLESTTQELVVAPSVLEPVSEPEPEPIDDEEEEEEDLSIDITDKISWDDINKFFSEEETSILFSFRESIKTIASGGKWSRTELFPKSCGIDIGLQRKFLKSAVEEGLLEMEGERKFRKYWLVSDRDDYDSFQLITKLVYPHTEFNISALGLYEENRGGDHGYLTEVISEFTGIMVVQKEAIESLSEAICVLNEKFDSQNEVILRLEKMVSRLLGESNGK